MTESNCSLDHVSIYNQDKLNTSVQYATLWLRHAEKDARYRKIAPFYGDCPISPSGKLDVINMPLPDQDRWVGVVCSPYLRCYSTALLLSQRLDIPCIVDLQLCNRKQDKVRPLIALSDSFHLGAEQQMAVKWEDKLCEFGSMYKNFIVITHNSIIGDVLQCIKPELGRVTFEVCGRPCTDNGFSGVVVPYNDK